MADYTASNGIKVENFTHFSGLHRVIVEKNGNREIDVAVTGDVLKALVEALDNERDEELGRWRWPENPEFVVYVIGTSGDVVNVMHETNGMCASFSRIDLTPSLFGASIETGNPNYSRAGRAYFEAHPERKPWEDAKPGEVWELTYLPLGEPERTRPFTVDSLRRFRDVNGVRVSIESEFIAGRRIWPEGDAS